MTLTLFDEPEFTPVWPDRPRWLLSYAYTTRSEVSLDGFDLIIDSGAFTTMTTGKEVNHDAYLDWLVDRADLITFAFSLDVIGDHHQSAVNHEYAVSKIGDIVPMVPTFHLGSPMSELERLCDANDLVGIGGAVPFASNRHHLVNVMKQIHRTAAERGTKLHGLGMTGTTILHWFPWFSVDSSTWTVGLRFPIVPLTTEDGRLVQRFVGQPLDTTDRNLIRAYDGDPDVMTHPEWSMKAKVGEELARERRDWLATAGARGFMYAEAVKNGRSPEMPVRVYLSGQMTAGALLAQAHGLGPPFREAGDV